MSSPEDGRSSIFLHLLDLLQSCRSLDWSFLKWTTAFRALSALSHSWQQPNIWSSQHPPTSAPAHLDDAGSIFEVCEGLHDIPTHGLHRLFPGGGKASNQLSDTS